MQIVQKKATSQRKPRKSKTIDYNKLSIGEIKEKANFYITELKRIQEVIGEIPSINGQISKALNPRTGFSNEPSFVYGYPNKPEAPTNMSISTDIAFDGLTPTSPPLVFSPIIPEPSVITIEEPQIEDNSDSLAEELRSLITDKGSEENLIDG